MPLKLEDKQAIIAEVSEVAVKAHSAVVAEYRGMTVAELTKLRVDARQANVYVRVIKNTLARRAVEGTSLKCIQEVLKGPVILALSGEDPGAPARVFRDFLKTNQKMVVKGVAIGGQLFGAEDLDKVAKLPTREEAIASLMSVIQAPITKFVRTLAEPHAKLVRTVAAIRDSKEAA
ncbi:ribosomal protein L10 [Beggiatoa alba B18LD]|uniref:Large ribosomal subunit protein uL10 n=1 Tax=Beggiatoa alba B18LD TaxID=395493 RepID=I3CJC9_9GAMM|nr:50S ribosomal protein L10 [Beggiatoa alba]EIJ43722.1 ribosomal protein L10 [Beggiatoa alba B18LD]